MASNSEIGKEEGEEEQEEEKEQERSEEQKRKEEQERSEEQKRKEEQERSEEQKRKEEQEPAEEQKRLEEQERLSKQEREEEQKRVKERERLEESEGIEEQEVRPSNRYVSATGPSQLFNRRSPYVHNPPRPEERRLRVTNPNGFKDYIINLREDLADFQESHGLPRTSDYSFLSLGLSLAQETGRAIYSILLLFIELFPILPIASLVLKFSLDKMIEILETEGTVPRLKKAVVFTLQLIVLMIPLWILVVTIIIPMFFLLISIIRRIFHLIGGKSKKTKSCGRSNVTAIKGKKKKMSFI